MATMRDIILDAYVTSGIKGLNQSVSGEELAFALKQIHKIIDDLNNQNLWSYTNVELTGNMTGGVGIYTIGPTGDIVGARPFEITSFAILEGGSYIPLSQIGNKDFFNLRRNEQVTAQPNSFRYQQDYPNGTLEVYPKPSKAYSFEIQAQALITNYGINDTISLPAGYEGYLEYALADRLAKLNRAPNPDLSIEAKARLANIKTQNRDFTRLRLTDLPATHSNNKGYNIYTDSTGSSL